MSRCISGVLCLTGMVIVLGCGPRNQFAPPPAPEVTAIQLQPKDVEVQQSYSGRIEATESVEVRARVKGFLQKIHFEPGEVVNEGDLLFTIEPDTYEATVKNAVGALQRTQAAQTLAETTFQRQKQLFESQTISELEFLQSKAQLDESIAAVKQAEGALQSAELDLKYTTIKAPIRGRVSRELVTVGNLVGSGENTLLTTIVSDDPVYAYFTIDEREVLSFIRRQGGRPEERNEQGPEVSLVLADGHVYSENGRINYADNQISQETGTIEIRAEFPNPNNELVPGIFGRVRMAQQREQALLIPQQSIQRDLSGPYVMMIDSEGNAQIKYIVEGTTVGAEVIVTDGLHAGDQIIVEGLQRVRPGLPVKVVAATEEKDPDEQQPTPEPSADESGPLAE